MSKNSSKSHYEQLMTWVPTLNQPKVAKEQSTSKFSKAQHYRDKGVR